MYPCYRLLILVALLTPVVAKAQTETSTEAGEVFTIVEKMPSYPGGQDAMFAYLRQNLTYPELARDVGISGTVYVTFLVTRAGKIDNVRILRGIGGGCDEEAHRVVSGMPDWEPGTQRGEPVTVQYNLPIRFTLQDKLYEEPELAPRFIGGREAMLDHFASHLVIPKKARKAKGMLVVRMEVDKDGVVKDPKVTQGLHPELDAEVLRIVSEMPPWQPGLVNGRIVRSIGFVQLDFPLQR